MITGITLSISSIGKSDCNRMRLTPIRISALMFSWFSQSIVVFSFYVVGNLYCSLLYRLVALDMVPPHQYDVIKCNLLVRQLEFPSPSGFRGKIPSHLLELRETGFQNSQTCHGTLTKSFQSALGMISAL